METSSQKKIHWLRLWTKGWLEGSVRFDLTPAQRSVFIDLCAMARQSRNPPMVQANETTPYPHSWLANKLNIPLELLEETLKLCGEQERISENSSGIRIIKFEEYQAPIGKQGARREGDKRKERTPEQKLDREYIQEVGLRHRKKKKELGRDLTTPEGQAIKDEVGNEIYGERTK